MAAKRAAYVVIVTMGVVLLGLAAVRFVTASVLAVSGAQSSAELASEQEQTRQDKAQSRGRFWGSLAAVATLIAAALA